MQINFTLTLANVHTCILGYDPTLTLSVNGQKVKQVDKI